MSLSSCSRESEGDRGEGGGINVGSKMMNCVRNKVMNCVESNGENSSACLLLSYGNLPFLLFLKLNLTSDPKPLHSIWNSRQKLRDHFVSSVIEVEP